MAESGAQPGNDNYRKGRIVAEQIRRQLVQNPDKLERLVRAQIEKACAGELASAIFIRDSLDGRPAQQLTLSGDTETPLISLIRCVVVQSSEAQTYANGEQSLTLASTHSDSGHSLIENNSEQLLTETPPLAPPRQVIVAEGDGSE